MIYSTDNVPLKKVIVHWIKVVFSKSPSTFINTKNLSIMNIVVWYNRYLH